jgi:hypothetical protein
MEAEAVECKKRNDFDLDLNRIRMSKNLDEGIRKRNERFARIYGDSLTAMETMRQRKFEMECLRKDK